MGSNLPVKLMHWNSHCLQSLMGNALTLWLWMQAGWTEARSMREESREMIRCKNRWIVFHFEREITCELCDIISKSKIKTDDFSHFMSTKNKSANILIPAQHLISTTACSVIFSKSFELEEKSYQAPYLIVSGTVRCKQSLSVYLSVYVSIYLGDA